MKDIIEPVDTDDGLFHDGDPSTGAEGTIVYAKIMNALQGGVIDIQAENKNILAEAKMTPDASKNNQVLTALKELFLGTEDDRVTDALKKDKNLSDLTDAAVACENLGLGSAAQSKSTDFFPAVGGTVGVNGVKSPFLCVNKGTAPCNLQGTWIQWNESNGLGESSLVNNKGTGEGGFNFRIVNADNTIQAGVVKIAGDGALYENGQRVYSPNNPPPANTSGAVTAVGIGGRVVITNTTAGWTDAWDGLIPGGSVLISAQTNGDDRINRVVYASVMYQVNGNWINAGQL